MPTKIISLALLLMLSACSTDAGEPSLATADSGAAISISNALNSNPDQIVTVRGYLVATSEHTVLTEVLAESFPPQAGGRSITVLGLDVSSLAETTTEGSVTWTDQPIEITGQVGDGVLVVRSGG